MASEKCPECGNEVVEETNVCPNCGHMIKPLDEEITPKPAYKFPSWKVYLLLLVILVILLVYLYS